MAFYRRNLPHWIPDGRVIFLTFRLYGSLPKRVVRNVAWLQIDAGEKFLAFDEQLDLAATGPRWLSYPEIAGYAQWPIERGAELSSISALITGARQLFPDERFHAQG